MAGAQSDPAEVEPPAGPRWYWTRRELAEWLVERMREGVRTVVGIDHAFSFPVRYFTKYHLPRSWYIFLDDFQQHWPTDEEHVYVDFIRDGVHGEGAARTGSSRWRRLTEVRSRTAKSAFHFDVPGSAAKATHAGLPWLRHIRIEATERIHFWPFDDWTVPPTKSVVAEVYPSLWRGAFSRRSRNEHQQIERWIRGVL